MSLQDIFKKKEYKFAFAVTVQIAILLIIVFYKMVTVSTGTEVLLNLAPIDPRDPLRGDYLTFRYDISTISDSYYSDEFRAGDDVYVLLRNSKSGAYIMSAKKSRSGISDDYLSKNQVLIKGVVTSVSVARTNSRTARPRTYRGNIRVKYGIEEYFIPEGSGSFRFWSRDVKALVVVDDRGNSVLRQIYVDGYRWPQDADKIKDITNRQSPPTPVLLDPEINDVTPEVTQSTGSIVVPPPPSVVQE